MVEPQNHCRRSVLGALDYSSNTLFYQTESGSVTRTDVIAFLDQVARQGDDHLTILVLDNAPVHRGIDDETRKRWFFEHNMCLLYLPAYSPELNVIEMVWKKAKYHWRRFINWSKETLGSELEKLLEAYGDHFAVNFS